jgi:integrase
MKKALTTRTVEAIGAGQSRQEIPDAYLPGLYLVVQPSGAKSWAVRYRHNGQPRKHTLGPHPAIDLKVARELGAKALRVAAEGRDPSQEKAQARAATPDSVDFVVGRFIERHLKRNYRPRPLKEAERLLRVHVVASWRGRAIGSITRADVRDMLDKIVDDAPIVANRAHSITRKLFNWAVEQEIVAASPLAGTKPPAAESSRDRVLNDDELRRVWQAAGKTGFPFGPLVQLLILTGQRRGEVANMEWAELDIGNCLWTLPRERTKNDRRHEVPLSAQAIAVIRAVPRIGDRFVFTLNGTAPINGFGKDKDRLDALLPGMPAWVIHDLRRTVASGMARLGINLPVIEKVLNHVSGSFAGIVGVYQRHDFADEKRKALDLWASHVAELVASKPAKIIAGRNR